MYKPEGYPSVMPYIFADDAKAYVEFLKKAFNGDEIGRTTTPDGTVANCQLRFGDAVVMVSEASADYPKNHGAFYIYVDDADAATEQAIAAGAVLEMEIDDMPYGDRQSGVRDPQGNIWWISQRLEAMPYF